MDIAGAIAEKLEYNAHRADHKIEDVLKMRWHQVKDGALWVEQGKTKARLQIDVVGELSQLLDRINCLIASSHAEL